MTPTSVVIDLPHLGLTAHRAGTGRRLLYLQDELAAGWSRFPDLLSERFDVVAPDLPGYGGSPRPEWLESIDDMAFVVADLADALSDGTPMPIVGAGLGGWMALEAAVRGAGASALVLIGAPGIDLRGDPPADYFVLTPTERAALFFDDPSVVPEADEDVAIGNEMMTARLVWQPRYVSPQLVHRLHRVAAPTLVVWGGNDRFLSPRPRRGHRTRRARRPFRNHSGLRTLPGDRAARGGCGLGHGVPSSVGHAVRVLSPHAVAAPR